GVSIRLVDVYLLFVFCFFFFFQAEDGIRDFHVTGVQTCALPISSKSAPSRSATRAVALRALKPHVQVVVVVRLVPHQAFARAPEIGRASCRERVEISVVAGSLKKKSANAME